MTLSALAAGGLLLLLALAVVRRRRAAPTLPPPDPAPPPTAVLLPVRDEADNVVDCVESLAAQSAAPRLRVIDDGSTDATPDRLARLRLAHPDLELFAARPLPGGWGGKLNALETGRTGPPALAEPWLLLTDADTRHAPDLLARAHAATAEGRLDALSLAGRQEARGAGEALLTPTVFALLDLRLGDWRPYARGEGRPPVANGQYFLVRRAALESIGGFAAVAGRALDDVELARALAAGGFRVGFRRADGALSVRMYRGFAATCAGWRRNLALFLAPRPATALAAAAFALASPLALAGTLATGSFASAASLWALAATASLLVRPPGQRAWALLAPLDALLLGALLLAAIFDRARGRSALWRGRAVTLDAASKGPDRQRP